MRRLGGREWLEWVLRALSIVILAALLWRSLNPRVAKTSELASDAQLASLLPRWTREGVPDSARLAFGRAPDAATRDWIAALRRAGMSTVWSGDSLVPSAISAERVADPAGGVIVRVGAPPRSPIRLLDDAGIIDTTLSRGSGATFRVASFAGDPRAQARGQPLHSPAPDSIRLRRLLVLGRVGWESKFTIAALEERGWTVDARLELAPGNTISQGTPTSPDTARYSALIVLDSAAATSPAAIVRYANDGGGVVFGGNASRVPAFAPILAGRAGNRAVPRQKLSDTTEGEGARYPIHALRSDAVILERDDTAIVLAARRVGSGRVVQLADEESWRRRMRRAEGSIEGHRDWWTRIVGSVAYAPRTMRTSTGDAAPLAGLVATLGPATTGDLPAAPTAPRNVDALLYALLSVSLLTEWGSRRWRGAA
jgi:hypothetical protein